MQNVTQSAMKVTKRPANGKIMPQNLRKISIAVILGMFAAGALSGCGRKGDPEAPTAYDAINSRTGTVSDTTNDAEEKPFFLDPLL